MMNIEMKKFKIEFITAIILLFIVSCTTNPPTNPGAGNFGTGKIFLNIKVDQTAFLVYSQMQ